MFLEGRAGDEDIVDVDEAGGESSEHFIHEPLARLRCVAQAERQSNGFPKAEGRRDGSLWDVSRLDWDLMECSSQVQLTEEATTGEVSVEVLQVRQWVTIRHGHFV